MLGSDDDRFLGATARKQYVDGTIIEKVQQKTTTRVLYYQVDTPITRDDPYYEISVQIKDKVYFGRHIPCTPVIPCPRIGVRVRQFRSELTGAIWY